MSDPPPLVALAEAHIPVVVAGSSNWSELAAYGPPYWRPRSAAELQRKIAAMSGPTPSAEYTFVIEQGAELVGECSAHAIDYRNRVAQLGICLWDPAKRGHGTGSRALESLIDWAMGYLGLRRLEAWIIEGNEASMAMCTRLGFVHEGTMKQRYLCDGRHRDVHMLAYLDPRTGSNHLSR